MTKLENQQGMTTYSWIVETIDQVVTVTLGDEGIFSSAGAEKRLDPYESITEVYLSPGMGEGKPTAMLSFNRKVYGIRAGLTIWGPKPHVSIGQAEQFNHFVRELHRILIERNLAPVIKFKCGVALNIWGWLIYGYPLIRGTALALAPVGAVAGLVMQSFGFVVTCVAGGISMLLAPKYTPPNVPKDLRRIRPYSPDAIPEGCFAKTTVGPEPSRHRS